MTLKTDRANTMEFAERARAHYSPDLPYHDWEHARDVMRIVSDLARRAVVSEISDNHDLLVVAAAWHDADYHETDMRGFSTKEERSADLAAKSLPELSDAERALLLDGILDTTVNRTPKSSLFGEVLHAADVGYFANDTDRFMQRLMLMREEWGSPDWNDSVKRTIAFGRTVIKETQPLMEHILRRDDAAEWIANIENNLDHLHTQIRV